MHSFTKNIFNKAHIFQLRKTFQIAIAIFFVALSLNLKAQCPPPTLGPVAIATTSSDTICSFIITPIVLTFESGWPGANFNWTQIPTNVSGSADGSGTTIADTLDSYDEINAGTVVYTITPDSAGCPGTPIFVTITVNPKPVVIVTPLTPICSGSNTSTLLSSLVWGTTFTWTVSQSNVLGATDGSGDSIFQVLISTGTFSSVMYSIVPTANGCIGETVNDKVKVNALPSLTLVSDSLLVCQGTNVVSLFYSATGGSPNQYSIDFDIIAEGQLFSDVPISLLPFSPILINVPPGALPGVYNAVLSVNKGACPGASYPITITIMGPPTPANAGPDQTICGADSTTLAADSVISGTGIWTVLSGVGGSFADSSVYNTVFSGTSGTTYVLLWSVLNNPCPPSTSTVTITFNQLPTPANAGPDQTICGSNSAFLWADTVLIGTGNWSILSGIGGSIADSTSNNTTFTGTTGNTYTLLWTVTNDSCASADSITITFNQSPTPANAGPDQIICGADSATLAANQPVLGIGNWSISSGGAGSFANSADSATVFTGTIGNTYVLLWTITNDSCASSDSVTITFTQFPTPANAGPDQTICGADSTTLAANEPIVGIGNWSISSGLGGSLANPADSASEFYGTDGNTYVLVWTISNDSCVSPDSVTITFSSKPLLLTWAQSICRPDSTIDITDSIVTFGSTPGLTYTYFIDAGADTVYTTPWAATADTYYIVGTLGAGCTDTATVTVTLNDSAIVKTNPQLVCSPATVDLTDSLVTLGSSAGLTFTYFMDSSATDSILNPTQVGSGTYYIVGETVYGCRDTAAVVVTVRLASVVTVPQFACFPGTINLTDTAVTSGSTPGLWFLYYTDSTITTFLIPPITDTTGTYWIVGSDGTCKDTAAVTVTINPKPTVFTTPPPAVCAPATIDLTLPAVTAGSTDSLTFTYYTSLTPPIHTADSTAITTSNWYFIVGTTSMGCSDTTPVYVTITPKPVINTVNQVRCSPTKVDLSAPAVTWGSTPWGGLTYTYFADSLLTVPILFPAYLAVDSGTYYIVGTTFGGCKDTASVKVTIKISPIVLTTPPPSACFPPTTIDLTDTSITSGSTAGLSYTYYTSFLPPTHTNDSTSVFSGTYFIVGTAGSGCSDTTSVTVAVNATPNVNTVPLALCDSLTVDLTDPAVTDGSTSGLTFTYLSDSLGTMIPIPDPTQVGAGTYYIVGTTPQGCSDTTAITVDTMPTVTTSPIDQCFPDTTTNLYWSIAFGSTTPGLTFTYFSDSLGTMVPVLGADTATALVGNYYIVGTTPGGCADTTPVSFAVHELPVVYLTDLEVCAPSTVNLSDAIVADSTTSGLWFSYYNSGFAWIGFPAYTMVGSAGIYYIRGTTGWGCSDLEPVNVIIDTQPTLKTHDQNVCQPVSTVDLTDSIITWGSDPGLTYSYYSTFFPPIPVLDPTQVGAGTYWIVGTAVGGCSDTAAVTININIKPNVNTNPQSTCFPGTIDLTLNAVTLGSSWFISVFTYLDSANTPIPPPTAISVSGTYNIIGTTGAGCSDTTSVSVTINPKPDLVATAPTLCFPSLTVDLTDTAITSGSSANLIPPGIPFTYWWDSGASVSLNSPDQAVAGPTYYIVGVTAAGCRDTASITFLVNPKPVVFTVSQQLCRPDTTFNLTLPSATAGSDAALTFTYFTNDTVPIGFPADTMVGPGSYWIVGTAATGCSDTVAINISLNAKPILFINDPAPICSPGSADLTLSGVTMGSTGGLTLSYYTDSLATFVFNTPDSALAGTYYIVGTTLTGCTDTAAVTVTVNSNSNLDSVAGSPTLCMLDSTTFIAYGVVLGGGTGTWSSNDTLVATVSGTGMVTGVGVGNCDIIYTILGGCSGTKKDSANITISTSPTVGFTVSPNDSICLGASVTLSGTGAISYVWTGGVLDNVAFTPLVTGSYTVTGTAFGCSDTAIATITVNPTIPIVGFTAFPNDSICYGDSVTLAGTGAISYVWTGGITNGVAFLATNATYTVTGTDAFGCTDTAVVTITVNPLPTVNFIVTPNDTICSGASVTLSGTGAISYVWTGGITDALAFTPLVPDSYTVTGTDAFGCSDTAVATIMLNGLPTIGFTASPNDSVCFGDSVTLFGTGAISYVWTGGITNGVTFLATNATYTVTGTDAFGCSDTAVATITVNPLPTIGFTAIPNDSICLGSSVTLLGTGATSYAWTGGVINGAAFSPVTTDTYSVTGTDALGCTNTATATITVNLPDSATFFYSLLTYCKSDPINPTPTIWGLSGGIFSSTPGLVFISTDSGKINLAASTLGTYNITYTTNGSCPNSSIFSITITSGFSATFTYDSVAYCQGGNPNPSPVFPLGSSAGIFTASPAGLVFVDTTTGEINLTLSSPGNYTVKDSIPASGGCIYAVATSTVTITALPVATFTYVDTSYCQNAGNPLPTFSGGGVAGVFSSTPGLVFVSTTTGQIDLAASSAGTYTVTNTIAPSGGCAAVVATFDIKITALPVATFSYTGTPYCQNVANPFPTFPPGGSSGIFSAVPSGLVFVSTATGQVDLAASNPGAYIVTDSIPAAGGCPAVTSTTPITIITLDSAAFSYPLSTYCKTGANPIATITGLPGGTFTALPAGLVFLNPTTGLIDLTASAENTYTISYLTNGLCPNTATFSLTITSTPNATFNYSSPSYCQGGGSNPSPIFLPGASAGIFSAMPAGLVFVSTLTGQIDLTASAAGNYSVTNFIAASGGCLANSFSLPVTINAIDDPSFNYPLSTYCPTGSDPTAAITGLSGGTFTALPAGLVFINNTIGLIDLSASATATYIITYTTNGSCPATATFSLTITSTPNTAFSYAGPYCQGGNPNPSPTFLPGASAGIFSAIPAGLVFVNTNTGQIDITASATGTYIVKNLISAGGCPADSSINAVTINGAPTIAVAGPDQIGFATCGQTTVTLAANAAIVGTGNWSIFSGGAGSFADPTDTATIFTGTAGATYVLIWTISNNPCTASTDSVTIKFNQAPTVADAGPDQTDSATCGLTSVTLSANMPGIGTGSWSVFSGAGGSFVDPTDSATVFSGTAGSSYVLLWTITNICGSSIDSVKIKFNQNPTIAVAGPNQTGSSTCGLTSVTLAANAPIVGTGSWSIFSGIGGNLALVTNPVTAFTGVSGSTYVLVWTITNAPCVSTDSVTITFNPMPTVVTNAPAAVCSPATVDLTLPAVTATSTVGLTFTYFTDSTATIHIADSSAVATSGTYYIVGTTAAGCTDTTAVTVTVHQSPSVTLTKTDLACFNVCTGTAIATVIGGAPVYTYVWSSGTNDTSVSTTDTITGLCAIGYTVTVTDANTCSDTDSINITQPPQISANITTTNVSCNGICDGASLVVPTGGTVPFTFAWNTGAIDSAIVGLCTGTYTVIVTDSMSCSVALTDTIFSAPPILSNAVISNATCGLCDGQITLAPTGGIIPYTFLWGNNDTTDVVSNLCAGLYSVNITDSSGCLAHFSIPISNPGGPISAVITGTNLNCYDQCIGTATIDTVIGGTAPYSYLWIPGGQTAAMIPNLCAGVYYVEIADSNGCSLMDSVTITQPAPILANQFVTAVTACDSCNGSIFIAPTGCGGSYSVVWMPGGQTTDTIINLCAGMYTVAISGSLGCTQNVVIPVNSPNGPALTTSTTSLLCHDSCNASASVLAIGVSPFSYLWSDPAPQQTSSIATDLCAGNYLVQVTDNVNCVSFASVVITNPAPIGFAFANVIDPLCYGSSNGSIAVIPNGGVLPYSFVWSPNISTNSDTALNLSDGLYTVTITDMNGCIAIDSNTLVNPDSLTISHNVTPASCNTTPNGAIGINVGGGTPGYDYSWSPNVSTVDTASNLYTGLYTVTVTDTNGCTIADAITLLSTITIIADAGNDTMFCEPGSMILNAEGSSNNVINYQWYQILLPSDSLIGSVVDITTTPPVGSTTYYVVVDTIGCSNSDTVVVTANPLPVANAGADVTILENTGTIIGGNPTGPTGSTYIWTPTIALDNSTNANPFANPITTTSYTVTVTSSQGCVSSDIIIVTVVANITFPNGISPNGDGSNDEWVIDNIELFPNSVVEVYNRWGELLFQSKGYVEKWKGIYKGKPLPIGTYYYIINLNDPLFPDAFTGPITVLR